MLENTSFTFNGVDSESMGVFMFNEGNGLYKDIFLPNRKIIETSTPYKNTRNFKRVEKEPLSFPLPIFIEKWRELNNIRQIVRWLDQDTYCPFWVNNDPRKILYVMIDGSSELVHNGCKDGYATMTMRSLYPFFLSPTYTNSLVINGTKSIHLNNDGDATIRPYLIIKKTVSDGDISILNEQNGQELKITGLKLNEVVDVDCTNEEIKSSLEFTNRYLYDNHNDVWLDFEHQTDSIFKFTGDFEVEFKYELVFKNELR